MRDWPRLVPMPKPEQPIVQPDGLIDRDWYAFFRSLNTIVAAVPDLELNDLANVDADAPADTDVLTWVDADGTWQPA